MPQLRQLEYLVAVAETEHFRRAAERVNVTQPTLSEQLKALELRLGAQLVERTRRRVVITPLGREIVAIARRMLADSEEIKGLAAQSGSTLAGVLRLGLPPTIGPYLLPLVIPALQRSYPDLKLYVREELPVGLPPALIEGRHDLIITLLPVKSSDLETEGLFRERLYLAMAKDHPLAKKDEVTRDDLAGQDVLALGQGHQLHDVVLALCEDFGARLRYDYEGTSLDTLREMVSMGLGLTFLPGIYVGAVATRDENLVVRTLNDRAVHRTVGLAWRRTSARDTSYRAFAAILRGQVAERFEGFAIPQS